MSAAYSVMPGLVPGIHAFLVKRLRAKTWMAGTSPAMTELVTRIGLSEFPAQ
jgi:hypothetical protein